MTDQQLQDFAQLLRDTQAELTGSLADSSEEAPVSPDSSIGRLTRQDAMQAQQMAIELRRRNRIRLQQIESALQRVEQGSYGVCLRCEEDISLARLRVRPEAILCVECAERK